MKEVFKPDNAVGVQEAVRDAIQSGHSLELLAGGSRRKFGRPVNADIALDLSCLAGVHLYEPDELILVVAPGTSLIEVELLLGKHGQHLAFEPPDYGPLWGQVSGEGTIGGAIMTGRNGPRRLTAGAARDFVLGVKAVNGLGEQFAAGGRVVKNVTGFDLPKLLTGSFGTLCAVTELTLKVLPKAPEAATFVVFGLSESQAIKAMQRAFNEVSAQISSAAFLPAVIAMESSVTQIRPRGDSVTLLRIEGFGLSVSSGLHELSKLLGELAPSLILQKDETQSLWKEIGSAQYFAGSNHPLWFLSVPPSCGAELGARLVKELQGRCFYDWAGGGIWFETPNEVDADALRIRSALSELTGDDGHATLIRAAADIRAGVSPFQPLPPVLAMLNERVRRQFDPAGTFNPGRMYENIDAN